MILQESGEMYLENILVLNKKLGKIRAIDIVNYMNFSKPSVSRAVNLLKDNGYISIDSDGYISLNPSGARIAENVYERHRFLSDFFISLGVEAAAASEDACKIEHVISDETFEALKRYVNTK